MTAIDQIDNRTRSETIADWYAKLFPLVAEYVKRKGGNLEEAKEIFQDTIIIYYEKLAFSSFSPEKSHEAYFMGIAKNRWLKYCSERRYHADLIHFDIAEEKEKQPVNEKLMNYLKQTGEKCMNLLQAFYYEKLNMNELANRFGYTSVRSATVQKYKCLEKVRNQIKSKSLSYEDFLN